jgi:hypothetical protein
VTTAVLLPTTLYFVSQVNNGISRQDMYFPYLTTGFTGELLLRNVEY